MLLLKIIYKAFYKTRNRKDNTQSAFSGLITLYLTITSTAFFIIVMKNVFPSLHVNMTKLILGIFIFGLGILTYKMCTQYVKKQFQNEQIYEDISYSIVVCRIVLLLISLIGVVYVPGTLLCIMTFG